jgi:DNA-binding GntR family transcriptional regulator
MDYMKSNSQPFSADYVFLNIRKRILKLELEPGTRISENQMAEEYGVSRTIIRNAFARLNQLGLLTVYPQRGTYVSLIDLKLIGDLLILRTAVEKEELYELLSQRNEEKIKKLVKELEDNLEKQESYRNVEGYDLEFQKLDSAFHRAIAESVERYNLIKLLEDLMLHISRWRNFDVALGKRMPCLIDEHRKIVDEIKGGDFAKAQQAMADHLETISEIRTKAKERYPQYFLNI